MHTLDARPNWGIHKDYLVRYLSMRSGFEKHVLGVAQQFVDAKHPGYNVVHVGDITLSGVRIRPAVFRSGHVQKNDPNPSVKVYVAPDVAFDDHIDMIEIPMECFLSKAALEKEIARGGTH